MYIGTAQSYNMEDIISGMDQQTLRELLKTNVAEYLKMAEGADKTTKAADIKLMKDELSRLYKEDEQAKLEATVNSSVNGGRNQERMVILREIKASLDSVPVFGAGMDVHVFLNRLSNLYELHVKGNSEYDKLEETFLRNCKQRISDSYLTQLVNSGEQVITFEEFKSYMISIHESKETHFQKLNKLWTMMPKEKESFVDFAGKLENQAHEVMLSIYGRWKKDHPSDKEIPMKACFNLFLGQILLQHIQSSKHSDVYKFIAADLDKAWTASEVANKALTIADRIKHEVDATCFSVETGNKWSNKVATVGGGGKDSQKSKKKDNKKKSQFAKPTKDKDCFAWLDGNCERGDNCGYAHAPAKKGTRQKKDEAVSMVTLTNSHFQN